MSICSLTWELISWKGRTLAHLRVDTRHQVRGSHEKRNSVLNYTKSVISARSYPKPLHDVTEESSKVPIKNVCTVSSLTFWKV